MATFLIRLVPKTMFEYYLKVIKFVFYIELRDRNGGGGFGYKQEIIELFYALCF